MVVRGARRGAPGAELGAWEYLTAIVILLGVAALVALSGCGGDRLVGADGIPAARPLPVRFGKVAVGARSVVNLVVKNEGNAPLTINGIDPGQDLPAVFVLPADARGTRVEAGATVNLPFSFSPDGEQKYEGSVVLRTDSRKSPSMTVPLSGQGARPMVQCSSRLDFGRVVLNQPHYQAITCINPTQLEVQMHVAGVQGTDAGLFYVGTNLSEPSLTIAPGANTRIEVEYTAGYLGPAQAEANLEIPGAMEPMLHVPLTGEAYASNFYATPPALSFGAVSVHGTSTLPIELHNDGTDDVVVEDVTLNDPDQVFGADKLGMGVGLHVPAGQSVTVNVSFTPHATSTYNGSIVFASTDLTNPRLQVQLGGRGGGAQLLVTPDRIDFGTVATNMLVTRKVFVSNVGTENDPLTINGATIRGDPASFHVEGLPAPVTLKPGDDPVVLTVSFQPLAEDTFNGELVIASTDGRNPELAVPLTGAARALAPCVYVVEPTSIQFGYVSVNAAATLSAKLRNVGADDCVFSSVALSAGSAKEFRLQGGGLAVATVPPGGSLALPVSFQSAQEGTFRGSVEFYVSDPTDPQGSVPVVATAANGCLRADPGAVDFGQQRLTCPVSNRSVTLTNNCAGNATVDSVDFAMGSYTAGEFTKSPTPRITLAPGQSENVTVHYQPADEGFDSVPMVVTSAVLAAPLTVPVSGEGTQNPVRTDQFRQEGDDPVDVLWVVDNSGSMMEEQKAIAEGFDSFINFALSQKLDYHIGVTTTGMTRSGGGWQACPGGVDGGEAGRLFPADGSSPRWITPQTPDAQHVFEQNVKVGICHWWEEGLEGAYAALSSPLVDRADDPRPDSAGTYIAMPDDGNLGFYRADARLAVIIVSDEDDHASRDPSFYTAFFHNLKGAANADRVTVNGILGDGCSTASGNGDRYNEVIRATGGLTLSICTSDWDELLKTLAENTFGYTRHFPLSGVPEGAVQVTVNGKAVNGWSYDKARNEVVFDETATPGPGTLVQVTYTPACGT
jgi:hypothetical protein